MTIVPAEIASALGAPYVPGWACRDSEPLQRALNLLYDYAGDIETKVLHRTRLNLFTYVMRRLVLGGMPARRAQALDVGCNAGYYSKLISDFGFESVLGFDIDAGAIEMASRFLASDASGHRREFQVRDALDLDVRAAYDFILCTEVIEHTSQPERVIANVCAALAPGGILVVTLPNAVSIPYAWASLSNLLKGRPADPMLREHLSFPFPRSLRLFRRNGLRLLETHGANFLLPQPVVRALFPIPGFGGVHRVSDWLARGGPLHYVSQFLCLVLRQDGP